MVKIKTLLMMALMFLAIGCQQLTREQIIEKQAHEKMKQIEKEGLQRIQQQIVNNLKYPESYESISTDMTIVTSDMVIYDSHAFVALRDLDRAMKNFNELYGNDSTSQEARNELYAMKTMRGIVRDRAHVLGNRPVEFEGIDVYHQFYANDRPGHKAKKGYHYIFHKGNRTTLLCDDEEFQRVKTFARQMLKDAPYLH